MPAPQARYFILTIPADKWSPPTSIEDLHPLLAYVKGQKELGEGGYLHWQVVCATKKKTTITGVKCAFCNEAYAKPSRSDAADAYVHKEDTYVDGTRFEVGTKALKRNSAPDWDGVWDNAVSGNHLAIPADIRIRCYHTIKRIRKDHQEAQFRPGVQCYVYWGVTGSGKSHRMFEEAGSRAYIKSSTTKWWDGYTGQEDVIIDEFRGNISVEHMLKWIDKYPCFVEEKGGQLALRATRFWIASNLDPRAWWSGIDPATMDAFLRRVRVTHFPVPHNHITSTHQEAVGTQVALREEDDPGWLDRFINNLFE